MAITPQAIKDQEFQTKFRGYDTIEVKAYLELVAEEFFELLETIRQQEQKLEELENERQMVKDLNKTLEDDLEAAGRTSSSLRAEIEQKEQREKEFAKELEEMQTALDDFEQERKDYEDEVSEAEGRVSEVNEQLTAAKVEIESLRNKIGMLEEQNRELKQGEVDFKRTIGVAQRFADDLRERSRKEAEEMLRASEEKANEALRTVRDEIDRLRRDAYAELSRLPEEIDRLNQQRRQVREELKQSLSKYLEELDCFEAVEEDVKHYEYDQLFQKIELPDISIDDELAEVFAEKTASPEKDALEAEMREIGEPDGLEDLDLINMELPLGDDLSEADEEEDDGEDLRNKLNEGGVAYLSDS